MDSSLSPTKRRALRNDTQPCCRLFYIAVSTVYSTYTTQNCFCPLLSFLRPIHIHCDATQLPYTNAILSRRWLSSIETFVKIRLSAGFHLGSSRLVNCHGHFWFLDRLHESFEVEVFEIPPSLKRSSRDSRPTIVSHDLLGSSKIFYLGDAGPLLLQFDDLFRMLQMATLKICNGEG